MWLFRKIPSRNGKITQKDIVERMDQAIAKLEENEEYRKNAIRARCIRQLEARLDEITEYMIENARPPYKKFHSQEFSVEDIFGIEDAQTLIIHILNGKNKNMFDKFLCQNKLTMGTNLKFDKVKFAYGEHSSFDESGWIEWAGYDYH